MVLMNPGVFVSRLTSRTALDLGYRGLIKLDLPHLLWIFVVCSIIGLGIEKVFHYAVYGQWQNRYGLVWGPFSPIYGCGAVLFTLLLNGLWKRSVFLIFFISMVVGCALEYVTGYALQLFLGISAWDYSGSFLSVGGKTSLVYGLMWGVLGIAWIRLLLPLLAKLFKVAPVLLRPAVTGAALLFITVDVATTIAVLDREFQRAKGEPAQNVIARACDEYFPDDWCDKHFENMDMQTENALR
jgi:uncharacterized membrane protein